jgi:hypothetical protein
MEARNMASAADRTASGDVWDREIEADLYDGGGVAMKLLINTENFCSM